MKIICFGDSNTYGYDPRSYFGSRYDHPWPEIIMEKTGWEVINLGLNGREIPSHETEINSFFNQIDRCSPADLLIIMLGTNDIFAFSEGRAENGTVDRMNHFLAMITENYPYLPILLLAPSEVQQVSETLIDTSRALTPRYERLSKIYHTFFGSLYLWGIETGCDGIHLTEEAHKKTADQVIDLIRQMKL